MNTNQKAIRIFLRVFVANAFSPQFIVAIGIPRKLGITEKRAYCRIRGLASE